MKRQRGTELWAAYLTDPRHDDEYRAQIAARNPDEVVRPELAGFDRHIEELMSLRADIAILIRGRIPTYPLPQGPIFPAERFKTEDDQTQAAVQWDAIAEGQRRWKELHG